jgi:predicted DNA-binding protein
MASYLIRGFPQVFSGAYCMLGYTFYGGWMNQNGRLEPGLTCRPWHGPLDQIKKEVRLVLMDGEGDPQCRPGAARVNCEAFLLDGFERVSYIEVPRLGHRPPDGTWFGKGLVALESKPKTPPTTRPTKEPNPGPGQVAQARRVLVEAHERLDFARRTGRPPGTGARQFLEQVLEEYPTTPAAAEARELLKKHYPATTQPQKS